MASPHYGPPPPDQVRSMIDEVKTLINNRMKEILREEGLAVSGIKSELQIRIIAHIEKLSNAGDISGLNRLRDSIRGVSRPVNHFSPFPMYTPPSSASPQYSSPGPRLPQPYGNSNMSSSGIFGSKHLHFKNSPFYTIKRPLTAITECKGKSDGSRGWTSLTYATAREHTRDTAKLTVSLSPDVAEQLQRDPNMRVMVFCAAESPYNPVSQGSEIAFPHQVELRCNTDDVKANLRGLKNKPGSTRPADITSLIRKKPSYPNLVEMIYALTQKAKTAMQKFSLVVNLVEKHQIEDMVSDIKSKRILRKEQVIREMTKNRVDAEIEATSTVLSLKCPLSATRIRVPCRSTQCAHNQCFDAASYLQLQEQAPTWTCPICNKPAPYGNLQLDLYVDDILKATSSSTEQVTIEPDGQWHTQGAPDSARKAGNPTPDDDDEDFVVIGDDRVTSLKQDSRLKSLVQTPPMSSREPSIASSAARSGKRPASEVIDLTLSDDDEPRPAKIKRPSMSTSEAFASRPHEPWSFELPRHSAPTYHSSPFGMNS